MRSIKFDFADGDPGGSVCNSWNDKPMEVLALVDELLAQLSMEVVVYETNDDSIIWSIEMKEQENA